MNLSDYKKKCPRCGTEIEPDRCASTGTKVIAGIMGACGGLIGFGLGGPVGAAAGAAAGYYGGKKTVMSIEDDHDENQLFQNKCPHCGCNWNEKIHTNDHPDDPSWLGNAPY